MDFAQKCASFPADAARHCQHVSVNCSSQLPGLFDYLHFTYCSLDGNIGLSVFLLLLLLGFLFLFIGTASSDYFSPNITSLSRLLRLPPDVSGVTLVAFGNVIGDLMGNIISFASVGSAELAIGELIGTGLISCCIVVGSIALMGRNDVGLNGAPVVRDTLFYSLCLLILLAILLSGRLYWWSGIPLLLLYTLHVTMILGMSNKSFMVRFRNIAPQWLVSFLDGGGDARQTLQNQTSSLEQLVESEPQPPTIMINDEVSPPNHEVFRGRQSQRAMATTRKRTMRKFEHAASADPPVSGISGLMSRAFPHHRRAKSQPVGDVEQDELTEGVFSAGQSIKSSIQSPESHFFDSLSRSGLIVSPMNEHAIRDQMPLAYRDYTPESPQKLLNVPGSRYSTMERGSPSPSRGDDRSSICENVINLQLQEKIFENMRNTSLTTAIELRDALNVLANRSDNGSNSGSESSGSPKRKFSSPVLQQSPPGKEYVVMDESQVDTVKTVEEIFEMCDRCPICFKCATTHLQKDWHALNTIKRHTFPLLSTWRIQGKFGRLLGIINFLPVMMLSLTVPVVSTFENDEVISQMEQPELDSSDPIEKIEMQEQLQTHIRKRSASKSPEPRALQNGSLPNGSALNGHVILDEEKNDVRSIGGWKLECESGKLLHVPWTHAYLAGIQLFFLPTLLVLGIGLANSSPFSGVPGVKGWMIGMMVGAVVASLFYTINYQATRLVRIKTGFPLCDDLKCAACLHKRKYRTFRERWKVMTSFVYWRYFRWFPYFSIVGFGSGILWIYLLSAEIISILKTLGIALKISDSVLGVTIFAFGNTVGDFATNIMIARLGYHSMAIGASLGGPIMNMLITLGIVLTFLIPPISNTGYIEISLTPIFLVCICVLLLVLSLNLIVLGGRHRFQLRMSYGMILLGAWMILFILVIILETLDIKSL